MSDITPFMPEKKGSLAMCVVRHNTIKMREEMKKNRKDDLRFSIHYSFVILFVLSFFVNLTWLLVSYFSCLLLHEYFHGLVAKKLGYKIGKIKLLATGAELEAESDEFSFDDEIKIAISGPLFNLILSLLFVVAWWLVPESYNFTLDLCVINLALFSFNMLPIFPLDGGRVLLACLSKKLVRKQAVKICKTITFVFSCLLFLLFIFSIFSSPNFSLGLMAVTLFVGGITEDKQAVYKRNFWQVRKIERSKNKGIEVKYLYVNQQTSKTKLLKLIDARHYTIFVLVDDNLKPVSFIREDELVCSFSGEK